MLGRINLIAILIIPSFLMLANCSTTSSDSSYASTSAATDSAFEEIVVTGSLIERRSRPTRKESVLSRSRKFSETKAKKLQSGLLTAGMWNDNRNLNFFLNYRNTILEKETPGQLQTSTDDHEAAYLLHGKKYRRENNS